MFSMGATPPSSSSSSSADSPYPGDDYAASSFAKAASAAGAATLAAAAATAFSSRHRKQQHAPVSASHSAATSYSSQKASGFPAGPNPSHHNHTHHHNPQPESAGFIESARDQVVDKVIETILAASIPEAAARDDRDDEPASAALDDDDEEEEDEDDNDEDNYSYLSSHAIHDLDSLNIGATPTISHSAEGTAGSTIINDTTDNTSADAAPDAHETKKKKKKRRGKRGPQQELSLSILASNIRKLNSRAGLLLQLQSNIVHILSWHQPSATISILILYAIICFNPHLLAGLPILLVLTTIMAPGYSLRHPIPLDLTPTRFYRYRLGHSSADAEEVFRDEQDLASSAKQQEERRAREELEQQRVLRERLRDLQNLLSGLVLAIETLETFVARVGSFADEEKATAIYLILLITLFTSVYFASFVPVNVAVLCAGWIPILLLHPRLGKYAKEAKEKYLEIEEPVVLDILNYVQENDVIIDDPLESRTVEIFELQRQGLTQRQWTPWVYTSDIYDRLSLARRAKDRPTGTRFLSDVEAPVGWVFSDEVPWQEDAEPKEWVLHRALRNVEIDLDSYWVYDYFVPGGTPQQRLRRRQVREMKKKRYSELVDADEYYIASNSEDDEDVSGADRAAMDDSSDDYLYDGDEYFVSSKEANTEQQGDEDLPVRGEWRRRRWIRTCYRL